MWHWFNEEYWRLVVMLQWHADKHTAAKPKPNKAPVKFHESHRRVMRSVNRNR